MDVQLWRVTLRQSGWVCTQLYAGIVNLAADVNIMTKCGRASLYSLGG